MRRLLCLCPLSLIFFALAILTGCGGGTTTSVSNPSNPPVSGATPTPATPSPTPNPTPTAAVVTRYAYIATFNPSVQGFSVNPNTGASTPLKQGPVAFGDGFSRFIAADKAGRFLFVSQESESAHGNPIGHDGIGAFRIDAATGNLTAAPGSPFLLNQPAGAVVVSQDGRFLYMSGINGILIFSIDQTSGTLALLNGSPFVAPESGSLNERSGIALSPSGNFLYQPQDGNGGQQGQIAVYSLNPATGIPTPITGSPFKIEPLFFADAIASDPQGRFLYTGGNTSAPNIDVQQVQSSGALSPAPGSPYTSSEPAAFIAVSPSGKFVYVVAGVDPVEILGFSVNSSGTLAPVPGPPVTIPNFGGITVDQTGKFLYVNGSGALNGYSIDPSSGTLTPLPGNTTTAGPSGVAVVTVAY